MILDAVIVGAGLAGLRVAKLLKDKGLENFALLESEDRAGGRLMAGLHLTHFAPAEFPNCVPLKKQFKKARIKGDKGWVAAEDMKWSKKEDWSTPYLPQWDFYLKDDLFLVDDRINVIEVSQVQLNSPVNEITKDADHWILSTPQKSFTSKGIFWSAGIIAFQNAVGKNTAQTFLSPNPSFNDAAREATGGLALDWTLTTSVPWVEAFDEDSVFALPIKHQGKYFLLIGVASREDARVEFRTLVYVPDDLLKNPNEVLSLQKSIKRGMRYLFQDPNGLELDHAHEKWVASARLSGASLASKQLLESREGIVFVGDESLFASDRFPHSQLMSANTADAQI